MAVPFSLRQRPRPNCAVKRARSRTDGPLAIVSTSLISPTISKFIPQAQGRSLIVSR